MTPIWMKTEYEDRVLNDRITEDFVESLKIVQRSSDPRHCFVAQYNEWAANYETCINTFIAGRRSFHKSISPSRLLRFCTTSLVSLCFLENIRCKDASCYDAGLFFVGILLLISLVTSVISIRATSIHGSSRSIISYTTEMNEALVEMGVRLNRTRRKFRLAAGDSQLYTFASWPTSNPLLSQNDHFLKLWLQSFLSWYDALGVVFSVQLSILFSIFDYGSRSDVLNCMSCGWALFLALLQDVKLSRSRARMDIRMLKSQMSLFLQWFQEECNLRIVMEGMGVLNLELLELFHGQGSSLKWVLTERSLKYVALVVHAAYGLQYSMDTINLTDAIPYLLFKKGNQKSELFDEEEEKANLQAEVTGTILDLTLELEKIVTELLNSVTRAAIFAQIEHTAEFSNLNQQASLSRVLDKELGATLRDQMQENPRDSGVQRRKSEDDQDEALHSTVSKQVENEQNNDGVDMDTATPDEIPTNPFPTEADIDSERQTPIVKIGETSLVKISNSCSADFQETPVSVNVEKSDKFESMTTNENETESISHVSQPGVKDSSNTADNHNQRKGITSGGEKISDMKIQEEMNTSSIQCSSVESNQESINEEHNGMSESVSNDNNVKVQIENCCKTPDTVSLIQQETYHTIGDDKSDIPLKNGLPKFGTTILKDCKDSEHTNEITKDSVNNEDVFFRRDETHYLQKSDHEESLYHDVDTSGTDGTNTNACKTNVIAVQRKRKQRETKSNGESDDGSSMSDHNGTSDSASNCLQQSGHKESQHQDVNASETDGASTKMIVCETNIIPVQTSNKESEANSDGEKEDVSSMIYHDGTSDSTLFSKVPKENRISNSAYLDTGMEDERHTSETSTKIDSVKPDRTKHEKLKHKKPDKDKSLKPIQDEEGTPKVSMNNSNAMTTLEKESALPTNPEATNIKPDTKINPKNIARDEINTTRGFEKFGELEGRNFDYAISNHTDTNENAMNIEKNMPRVEENTGNFLLNSPTVDKAVFIFEQSEIENETSAKIASDQKRNNPTDDKGVFRFSQTATENETSTKIAALDRHLKKPNLKRKSRKDKFQSSQRDGKQRLEKTIRNSITKTSSEKESSVPINPEATTIQSSFTSISSDIKIHSPEGLEFDGLVSGIHGNASSKEEIFGKKSGINFGADLEHTGCASVSYVLQQNDTSLKFNEEKSKQDSLEKERTEKSEQNLSNDVNSKCRVEWKPNNQTTSNECIDENKVFLFGGIKTNKCFEPLPSFGWNRNPEFEQNNHGNEVDQVNKLCSNKMKTCKDNVFCITSTNTLPKCNTCQSDGTAELGGGRQLLDSSDPKNSEDSFAEHKQQNGSRKAETSRPLPHSENIHSTEHKTNSSSELHNWNSCQKDESKANGSSAVFPSNLSSNPFFIGQKMETTQVLHRYLVPDTTFAETSTGPFSQSFLVNQITPATLENKQTGASQGTRLSEDTKSRQATAPREIETFPKSAIYDSISEIEHTKSIIDEPRDTDDQSIKSPESDLAVLSISANHKIDFTRKWIDSSGIRADILKFKEDEREENKTVVRETTPGKSGLKKRRSRNYYYSSCNDEEDVEDQCRNIKVKESCNDTVRLLHFYTSVMKTRHACVFVKHCKSVNVPRLGFSKFQRQVETKCISISSVEGKQVSSSEFTKTLEESDIPPVSSRNRHAEASRHVENFEDEFRRPPSPGEAQRAKVLSKKHPDSERTQTGKNNNARAGKKKSNRRSAGRYPKISPEQNRFEKTHENYSTDEVSGEEDCYPEWPESPSFENASRSPDRQRNHLQTSTDRRRSQPTRWGPEMFQYERAYYHSKDQNGFSNSKFYEISTSSHELESEISDSETKAVWDSNLCLEQNNASKSVDVFESCATRALNETGSKLCKHTEANPELSVVQDSSPEPQTCNLNIGNLSLKFSNNSTFTISVIQGDKYEGGTGTDTTKTPSSHSEILESVDECHPPLINQIGPMRDAHEKGDTSFEQLEEIEADGVSLKKNALPATIRKFNSDTFLKDSTCVEILDESAPTPQDNSQGIEEAANALPLPSLVNTGALNQQSENFEEDSTISERVDRQCQLSDVSENGNDTDHNQDYNFEASGLEFNFRPTPQSRALQIQYQQKQARKTFIFESNSVKLYLTQDTHTQDT